MFFVLSLFILFGRSCLRISVLERVILIAIAIAVKYII